MELARAQTILGMPLSLIAGVPGFLLALSTVQKASFYGSSTNFVSPVSYSSVNGNGTIWVIKNISCVPAQYTRTQPDDQYAH